MHHSLQILRFAEVHVFDLANCTLRAALPLFHKSLTAPAEARAAKSKRNDARKITPLQRDITFGGRKKTRMS
jgi:hypothetical protein